MPNANKHFIIKRILVFCTEGVLVVYATSIFFVHFSGSATNVPYFQPEQPGQAWVAQGPTPTHVSFLSNMRVLWRIADALPPSGTGMYIWSKLPINDDTINQIRDGEIDLISAEAPTPDDNFVRTTFVRRVGLPTPALRYRVDMFADENGETQLKYRGGFGISGKYVPGLESWRTLSIPLMPVFPGFIVGVIFWGLVGWGMEYVVRALLFVLKFVLGINRRKTRAERLANNQCVTCGYPLDDLERCPECGAK